MKSGNGTGRLALGQLLGNRAMMERHLRVPLVDETDWAAPAGDLLGFLRAVYVS